MVRVHTAGRYQVIVEQLYVDYETYSETPIKHGTGVYTANCEPLLLGYAIDDAPARVWTCRKEAMPDDLADALADPAVRITAHNAAFDRSVMLHAGTLERTAAASLERWSCTVAQAHAHGLPGSLGHLCEIFRLDDAIAKDTDGSKLVQLFCKPRPLNHKLRRATAETHPQEWARFVEYCRRDVEAMRELKRRMPSWNYRGAELALWRLDQKINERGVAIDVDFARAAVDAVAHEKQRLRRQVADATNGLVGATTQRDRLLAFILLEYGVTLPDMQASTLERRLDDPELPQGVRDLIAVRLAESRASTAKYQRFLDAVSTDGRVRHMFVFAGASRTRRFSGRVVQLQNMTRPDLPAHEIEAGIEAIKAGVADVVVPDVMRLASNAVRGVLIAPPRRKFCISDLANIEGRGTAWLAGEQWKLDAFRAYDEGGGPDLYKLAYARAFNVEPGDVDKKQRQIGKAMELMLGYGGGVGAFITGAATYSIDLEAMADACLPSIPEDVLDESIGFLAWTIEKKRPLFGLPDDVFVACDALKRLWRRAHPKTAVLWSALEQAVRDAIATTNTTFNVAPLLKVQRDGSWLRIRLPSGNYLCYLHPRIENNGRISYLGVSAYTHQWQRIGTYGGKLVENCVQSLSRDVLTAAMPHAEDRGYQIVLHAHDELVCETPDHSDYSCSQLSDILSNAPAWARGLPLAAAGFECTRYRKE